MQLSSFAIRSGDIREFVAQNKLTTKFEDAKCDCCYEKLSPDAYAYEGRPIPDELCAIGAAAYFSGDCRWIDVVVRLLEKHAPDNCETIRQAVGVIAYLWAIRSNNGVFGMYNCLHDVFPIFHCIRGITPKQVRDVLTSKCLLTDWFRPNSCHDYLG